MVGDAATQLEIPQSGVTVITRHMGGGFGSKLHFGVEGQLACRLAKEAQVPVKLMLTRHDEFLMAGNRSGSWQKIKAGVSSDGTLQAMVAMQYRLGGIGLGTQAPQPLIYQVANVYRELASIHTNIDSSRAMRAPGRPQASFAIESVLDELAYKLGMDPIELRKKNVTDAVHGRQLDRAAKEIGWEKRPAVAGGWPGTLKRGFGCACTAWGGGGGPLCIVHVAIARDGSVIASVGSQDLGTGTRTYIRAIVAEELGLALDQVSEKIGDSSLGPANASGGSITTASLSPAVKDAANNARLEFAKRVAPILSAQPDQVIFSSGQVTANGKAITWKQACAALPAAGISARGQWQANLASAGTHGVTFAEVEVDVETGRVQPIRMVHVQDMGLPLNRLAIESQINGGMIQALGMALFEERIMDGPLGVMLNPNFGDYKLPGCLEMPELVPLIDDQDTRQAVVGMGEPPVIPGAAAIANAVFNACGVRVRQLPITADKVLMSLIQKGSSTS
jgi:xanthine dehydrogenase YagR molybdenum-binding subunit